MVEVPQVTVERVSYSIGDGSQSLRELVSEALAKLGSTADVGGVVAATFSNPERFPSLAVSVASEIGLPSNTPALDLQMACSAYPYAAYLAGRLAVDAEKKILVVNGDVQSRLVDRSDHATGAIFSDAATVSVVSSSASASACSRFAFFSRADDALTCSETGPIRMNGMKVFGFVAMEVRLFLKDFLDRALPAELAERPLFVPHQANPYMVRQLAKSLGFSGSLLTIDPALKNPGSCSVPLTLALNRAAIPAEGAMAVISGFGAGYSASVGLVRVL